MSRGFKYLLVRIPSTKERGVLGVKNSNVGISNFQNTNGKNVVKGKLNDSLFRLAKLKTCVKSEKPRANEEESRSLFLYILCTIVRRSSSVEAGKQLLDDHSTVAVCYFCSCALQ